MITSLETLLRDADEPRVGRYGEQELRGIVTKFKSSLYDDAGTDHEEVLACTTPFYQSISIHMLYSLRPILSFVNTDVSSTKICLDISVFAKGNIDRREYVSIMGSLVYINCWKIGFTPIIPCQK
jgi:hypothetical protein